MIRLHPNHLRRARTDGLLRLATWLGVAPRRGPRETEVSYRATLAQAIMNWEFLESRRAA